ncbi:MAG: AMIN domain-containing protein, partial [Chromatiaceae bacterium]|nr:AMIN domain-containing protein [Chromatiaceae bacterium]
MQALSFMRIHRSGPALVRIASARSYPTWLLILSLAWPASGLAAALKDVEFASLPGNQVRIDLVLTEAVAAPRDFSTESPARIVLDLPGVTSELPRKNVA